MRTIRRTSTFKKDFKRVRKGRHGKTIGHDLSETLKFLVDDKSLPARYVDHGLGGEWKDHRDCHIKPDLVLIYRKHDAEFIDLVRLGSHSELGL